MPLHRWLFDWYFGRAFMEITPSAVRAVPGADRATLITLDADGLPLITPLAEPPADAASWPLQAPDGTPLSGVADGPATILVHAEDAAMRDLRQQHLRGAVRDGAFVVATRHGTVAASPPRGWWAELREQLELRRRGRAGRARVEGWKCAALTRHTAPRCWSFWLPGLGQLYRRRWWRGRILSSPPPGG